MKNKPLNVKKIESNCFKKRFLCYFPIVLPMLYVEFNEHMVIKHHQLIIKVPTYVITRVSQGRIIPKAN